MQDNNYDPDARLTKYTSDAFSHLETQKPDKMKRSFKYGESNVKNIGKADKSEKVEEISHEFTADHKVRNEMVRNYNSTLEGKTRNRDKKDHATLEGVIDAKTRIQLKKFVDSGMISKMNKCISAGKEANVYHAVVPEDENGFVKELAIKIYKVETMVFRDREDYIVGERRFRKGICTTNPRKLIKLWAEKEFRNLKRIQESGLKCPIPIEVKDNLVVMDFLGKNNEADPRLRDVPMDMDQLSECY